jgi:AAA15 family ATPase/GTPase
MIESIEIKNFRCFKDTKIAKFGLVNLFGGMNNAGKTALLEAVHLIASPSSDTVMFLQRIIREISLELIKQMPDDAWNGLYYQQDKQHDLIISSLNCSHDNYKITLKCDEELSDFVEFSKENPEDEDMIKFSNALSEKDTMKSALHIDVYKNDDKESSSVLVASRAGVIAKGSVISKLKKSKFIPASAKLPNYKLAIEFDKAKLKEREGIVLDVIKVIDSSIESVETLSIGGGNLHLKRKDEKRMPLSYFGDAVSKVVNITLTIINNPNSIVIIDEIENGIHHTAQAELWAMLFKLAIAYDTQIFATTHSSEMIKSFAKVAQDFPDKAAYFEMARSPKTNLIKAIKHDVETLRFELDRNILIRGE